MRERSFRVDTAKLVALSTIHRPSHIAKTLGISKQRWHLYKIGKNDIPESMLDRICDTFKLNKDDLALG